MEFQPRMSSSTGISTLNASSLRMVRRAIWVMYLFSDTAMVSPSSADKGRRLAEAAHIGVEQIGDSGSADALLGKAQQADPTSTDSLHGVAATVNLLLNRDGDVATACRLLVVAIETGSHGYDAHDGGLNEAMHTLLLVCWFGGRPELSTDMRIL